VIDDQPLTGAANFVRHHPAGDSHRPQIGGQDGRVDEGDAQLGGGKTGAHREHGHSRCKPPEAASRGHGGQGRNHDGGGARIRRRLDGQRKIERDAEAETHWNPQRPAFAFGEKSAGQRSRRI
jgi:hypothetical protein